MFKKFLLNQNYSFDIEGNCKERVINGNKISIEINNKVYEFDKKWLGLLCHYEVDICIEDIFKIEFVLCDSKVIKLRSKQLMIFRSKIKFKDDFYFIPGFTRFAINKNGLVMSVKHGRILKSKINSYGYPYVNVYDPDKNRWRSIATHILLARTFIINKNPSKLFFVNHRNGNKKDLSLSNLEWVDSVRNNSHAIESSLRKDNKPCKMRDIETSDIKVFNSVSSCLKYLGYKNLSTRVLKKSVNGNIPHLLLGRYEIKYLEDTSDWFYTKDSVFLNKYQNIGPYEAFCIITKAIFVADTISELSRKINIKKSRIEQALSDLEIRLYDNFLIRRKSDEQWPVNYKPVVFFKARCFRLKNVITGEIKEFNSLRKAVKFLGIDKRTFKLRLEKNKPYENWEIKEICSNSPIN